MKKILSFVLILLMLLGICACSAGNNSDTRAPQSNLSITYATDPTNASGEQSTDAPTQAPTQAPTAVPTAAPTEAPTKAPTQVPTQAPTPKPTDPPHVHVFGAATCTKPKTCSCGATEGNPNGHSYYKGTCSDCGATDPDYVSENLVWIPTNGGKKYHTYAGCSNMIDPEQVTKSEAEALGFTPCKKCH